LDFLDYKNKQISSPTPDSLKAFVSQLNQNERNVAANTMINGNTEPRIPHNPAISNSFGFLVSRELSNIAKHRLSLFANKDAKLF
jgi:hypothetical protein